MTFSALDLMTEFTNSTLTFSDIERWSWTDFSTADPVPRTMRYCHHPRVSPSNPKLPRKRYNMTFKGHQFKVGRSKK